METIKKSNKVKKSKLNAFDLMAHVEYIRIMGDEAKILLKLRVDLEGFTFPEPLIMLVPIYIRNHHTNDGNKNFDTLLMGITEVLQRYGIASDFEMRYQCIKNLSLNEYSAEVEDGLALKCEIKGYNYDTGYFDFEVSFGAYKETQKIHITHINAIKNAFDYFFVYELHKDMERVMGLIEDSTTEEN